jgi:hypothetical protein
MDAKAKAVLVAAAAAGNTKAKANLAILAAAAKIKRDDAKRWAAEQDALEQIVRQAHSVRAAKTAVSLAKKGGRKQRQTRRQRQSRRQRQNQ